MLMSRIKPQRKSLLALFMIAIFAISINATQGATPAPAAPSLKPTNVRLEYLGRDSYGYNYRVIVTVKNEGGAMTPNNTTTTPAVMLNVNESSGSGNVAVKLPMLGAGAEYPVVYSAAAPIGALTYVPGGVALPADYKGLPGCSLVIATATPYLYVTAGVMPDAQWSHDYSLYKTITKTFEIKDGRAVESAPDFKITEVKIVPVSVGANPGQRFNAEVKITNAGGPFYKIQYLKYYPISPTADNANDVVVGLRVTNRYKVSTGYVSRIKSPVIKAGQTETLRFLLPSAARDMAGYSVKAMVNYGWRHDLQYPQITNLPNNSLMSGNTQQSNPFSGGIESNYINNYWTGYPTIAKPDLKISAPRVISSKMIFPTAPKTISSSTPFACYPGQMKGDLDHDGKITSADATLMTQAYLGILKPVNTCCIDLDSNGKVDINEPQKVTNASFGLTKLGYCSQATNKPMYYATANVVNQGAPVYIGSSTVRVAFRINFTVGGKATSTTAVAGLTSKSGWLGKGSLGEVKADMTNVFSKYIGRFKVTKNVVKIDANSVTDTSKGVLFEANDLNNTATSKQ